MRAHRSSNLIRIVSNTLLVCTFLCMILVSLEYKEFMISVWMASWDWVFIIFVIIVVKVCVEISIFFLNKYGRNAILFSNNGISYANYFHPLCNVTIKYVKFKISFIHMYLEIPKLIVSSAISDDIICYITLRQFKKLRSLPGYKIRVI